LLLNRPLKGSLYLQTVKRFSRLFGGPPRKPETEITQKEMDLARSVQAVTEKVMLRLARHAYKITGQKNLCLAGGVALNCVANGRILRECPFENIFIQPASGDAGGALGAALATYYQHFEQEREPVRPDSQQGSYLGPEYSNDDIRAKVGDANEPYRALLRPLVNRFIKTRDGIDDYLAGKNPDSSDWIESDDELIDALMLCHQSLIDCGMQVVANGLLLDTIRRARVFGIHLLRLDVRQDSERHSDVFSELTRYLGLGDYAQWSEADKQAFLLRELGSKRPLFPAKWDASDDVKEVLDTCKVVAKHSKHGFGIYIISMASEPSDVLAVQLLLQESGVSWPMPVAPLFETLDDLNNSPDVMRKLLSIDWYRGYVKGRQFVMIGYSDSAKDAGALAAGWAQYQSQEALVAIAEEFDVSLTLFHGRGGTIGRGGLPAHAAIYSQPPGSLEGGFRVTEQGETIRYKFGMPTLAKRSLGIYASAIIEAMLFPPPAPKEEWRELITTMAGQGRDNYRATVRHDEEFVPYFRVATPEQELGKLPLGSRPAKRKPQGGIESLRAIPWIFAWAQTRLVLPSWLGVMRAIDSVKTPENEKVVNEMFSEWPFYRSRLSMLDMVFHKADPRISEAYDERLVPKELKHFGEALRSELKESISSLLAITGEEDIMANDPQGKESMEIRAAYLQPLH